MKYILFYNLIFVLFFPACFAQSNKGIVKKVIAKYQAASSISFTLGYRVKHFSDNVENITSLKRDCRFVRNDDDTLFGGNFWYDVEDTGRGNYCEYYNEGYGCYIDHCRKTVFKYDLKTDGFDFRSEDINYMFTNPRRIIETLKDRQNKVSYNDTIINKFPFAVVTVRLPDLPVCCSDTKYTLFFNKETIDLEKIVYRTDMLGEYEFIEWNLNSIVLNKETGASLKSEFEKVTADYFQTDYVPNTSENSKPLANGTPAPAFTGYSYPGYRKISLSNYRGKIVLLYFWYMRGWDTDKMPALNRIQQKFGNEITVLGVNAFDNHNDRLSNMSAFLKKHSIIYPIAFIDPSVLQLYNIPFGPTLYVIDQNGIISHSKMGGENLELEIEGVIRQLLKK